MTYKDVIMERRFHSIPEGSFERAEELIGIKFPYPLYELIKNNDAGCPRDTEFLITLPGENRVRIAAIDSFLSFNPRNDGNIFEDYFDKAEHHPQDERFVPFGETGNGDKFLFFYENGKDDPEPKVYYWAHEYWDVDGGLVFLANSFVEFLDMLKPDGYYDSL